MNKVSNHQTKYIGSTSLSYEDIEKVTRCEYLNDKLGDFYINLLQEREYRFHHQKLKRADQTCFMFLDCLKTTQIKHPIKKRKDTLRNVRFTQRRMIEEKKTDKIPKNYETFLLNNICYAHYTCLHIKFGALLNDISKEGWMVLEYDSMRSLKRPLKMSKKEIHGDIFHYMTKAFEGCENEEEIHIYGMPCPQQRNCYDCMLYSIYCMEALSFCAKKDDTIILKDAMAKKVFFKSSEVESRDLFIAAIIQQRLVTDLLEFGSFSGFVETLDKTICRKFEDYIECIPVSDDESKSDTKSDGDKSKIGNDSDADEIDDQEDQKESSNEKSKKRKHMAKPKGSNIEAFKLWINSGERGIVDKKCSFVSSNPLEVLGLDESARIDRKVIKRQWHRLSLKVSDHS